MKYSIPEISWHNRDPVLSIDIQPKTSPNDPLRLATGGTDSHVLIWHLKVSESGSVGVDVAADLTRHQKAVNVVRWSPNGQLLASGDDESIIFIWRQNAEKEPASNMNMDQGDEQYKEFWIIHKTLRGHMEDVLDLSWSPDSLHLASGSVDNKLLIWDLNRGRYSSILADHKGFVQGVAWDPKGQLIASTSSDRTFRTFDVSTKKVVSRSSKAILPFPPAHPLHGTRVRLYHDDTLQTFYRRLEFSPDGMLVAVPAGKIEAEQGKMDIKPINAVYIYTRYSLKVPACILPCDSPALACRWSPRAATARAPGPAAALPLRARLLLAVATRSQVVLYDTQQRTPVAILNNIHYTRLTDLTWSRCGRVLAASSTDGFVSMITFTDSELGQEAPLEQESKHTEAPINETGETKSNEDKPEPAEHEEAKAKTPEAKKPAKNKIDSFIKFKSPGGKSPKKAKIEVKKTKTPVKIDVMEEVARPAWSDNSSSEIIHPIKETEAAIVIEDSEDMKLVYEDTVQIKSTDSQQISPDKKDEAKEESIKSQSPVSCKKPEDERTGLFKQARVTDAAEPAKAVPSPKAPRRVSFVTLSSPKTKKK